MTAISTSVGTNRTGGAWAAIKKAGVGVWVLLLKVGGKLLPALVKTLKAFKFGKITLTAGSMGAYALLFSWQFALIIMGALFVHEYGHVWAMKRCGMKVRGIYFIPLLGAAAVSDSQFQTRGQEVYVGLMGPIWGGLLAFTVFGIYLATGSSTAAAIAGWMALFNVFNLLPINPLDGGRIVKSITWSISSKLGLVVTCLMLIGVLFGAYYIRFGLFVALGVIALFELLAELKSMFVLKEREAILKKLAPLVGLDDSDLEAVRLRVMAAVEAPQELYQQIQKIVEEERKVHLTIFRRRPYYYIGNKDWISQVQLEEFFGRKFVPTMTLSWTVISTLAYFGLVAGLLALMFVCREVPAAEAALQALLD